MPEARDYNDLCSTCIHTADCTRRIYARAPIWDCDEFDDRDPQLESKRPARAASAILSAARAAAGGGPPAPPDQKYKGLCATCENRLTCNLPRPEGGVWHCEEYM